MIALYRAISLSLSMSISVIATLIIHLNTYCLVLRSFYKQNHQTLILFIYWILLISCIHILVKPWASNIHASYGTNEEIWTAVYLTLCLRDQVQMHVFTKAGHKGAAMWLSLLLIPCHKLYYSWWNMTLWKVISNLCCFVAENLCLLWLSTCSTGLGLPQQIRIISGKRSVLVGIWLYTFAVSPAMDWRLV